jgi:hypothetical protein
LFILNTAAFITVSSYFGSKHSGATDGTGGLWSIASVLGESAKASALSAGSGIATALLLAMGAAAATLRAPVLVATVSLCICIGICMGLSVMAALWGMDPLASIFAVFGALVFGWTLYRFRQYKEYAAALIGGSRAVMEAHGGTRAAGFVGSLASATWTAGWIAAVLAVGHGVTALGVSEGGAFALGVWSIFTLYWVAEVIKGTVLVTIAGATGSWFYATDAVPARSPTASAAYRALTLSFGSVCLGSLIIAILQTLRRLLNGLRHARGRNIVVLILALVASCILGLIEAVLRLFNKYVFVHVAIYGDTYLESARKTKELFGTHGFEMVMQSNVVVSIMTAVLFVSCAASTVVTYFLFGAIHHAETEATAATPILLAMAVLICTVFIVDGAFAAIDGGSCALLVLFFRDRAVCASRRPELYALLVSAEERVETAAMNRATAAGESQ